MVKKDVPMENNLVRLKDEELKRTENQDDEEFERTNYYETYPND